jgi:putative cardiolipin synthase
MKNILMVMALSFSLSTWAQEKLSDSIPYPFYEVDSSNNHEVMSIIDGYASLQIRLEMIRRAKKNIEVEYFIYNDDVAGKILTRELIEAAKRGVKVRILIDKSKPIFEFEEFHAKEVAKFGIEVRYYNSAPLIRISTVQFRNHRKLISVDDSEAITGGRNIGDDYFDFSEKFNFTDTDIYVQGPIVKTMRESFDKFFNHKMSERINFENLIANKKEQKEASDFILETEEELKLRERVATIGKRNLDSITKFKCPEITFVSDAPGGNFFTRLSPNFDEKHKFVRKALYDKISVVDKSVLISSPYLLVNRHSRKLYRSLLKKGVKLTVYTNSLASTDAIYVASNLYFDVFRWVSRGVNVFLHDGKFHAGNLELDEKIKNAKWGTHSKVQVYESSHGTEAMIGTYNIDNRSNFYNSEMAVFCRGNDEFTAYVKNQIQDSIKEGIRINSDGTAIDHEGKSQDIFGSSRKGLLIMNLIFLPSWLLKFLL